MYVNPLAVHSQPGRQAYTPKPHTFAYLAERDRERQRGGVGGAGAGVDKRERERQKEGR